MSLITSYTHRGYILHSHKIQLPISLLPVKIQSKKISSLTDQNGEEVNIAAKQQIEKINYIMRKTIFW